MDSDLIILILFGIGWVGFAVWLSNIYKGH